MDSQHFCGLPSACLLSSSLCIRCQLPSSLLFSTRWWPWWYCSLPSLTPADVCLDLERISSWALLNRFLFSLQMVLQYPVPSLCHPLEDRRMRISTVPVTCKQLENSCVKKSNHAAWAQQTRASQQPAVALCSPHGNWCQLLPLVFCVLLCHRNKAVALQLPHVHGKMQIFPVQIKQGLQICTCNRVLSVAAATWGMHLVRPLGIFLV